MSDKMKQSETIPAVRVTPFEAELQEVCAKRQGANRTTAVRRAMVRGSYNVIGASGVAALRRKHGLSYEEMLEILGVAPEGELPKPYPREGNEAELAQEVMS